MIVARFLLICLCLLVIQIFIVASVKVETLDSPSADNLCFKDRYDVQNNQFGHGSRFYFYPVLKLFIEYESSPWCQFSVELIESADVVRFLKLYILIFKGV